MAEKQKDIDILKEIKDRFKESYDAWDNNYTEAINDLNFYAGDQWPSNVKSDREADGRPCLVINKIPTFGDQVIGDIRQNEPSIKVKPVDSKSDPKTAEIITGLIRNIEAQSDAEIAYDTAAESAVICGIGAFRIGTHYCNDDVFEQDIEILRIKNPFTIYWDPAAQKWDKSDARYCFVTEKIARDEFEVTYPNASLMSFQGGKDNDQYWGDDKNIRVVEYFKKEKVKKTVYMMQSGDKVFTTDMKPDQDKLGPGWQTINTREVDSYKITWYKATQAEILEGPTDWPGKHIPICMVYGKELNIEGRTEYRGVTRFAKDPQRLYNYSRSHGAEVISLAPKAPYLVTMKQIANYQSIWDKASQKNFPYLPYDVDPSNPTIIPTRSEPISANTGINNEIMIADQELHDTTGLQQASLGKKSNEKSGKAIIARQREGDVANFAYYDNLGRAIKYGGKVILDLIPKIYDTPRIIRILNEDGSDKLVPINTQLPPPEQGQDIPPIYDLTVGKYDVVVSIGPSYSTQREESVDSMMAFLQAIPQMGPLIGDLIAKNMDWPGASEIEKRLKLLLPPALQGDDGQPPPVAPQPPPDPLAILAQKKAEAQAQGLALDNETKHAELQRLKSGNEIRNK